MEIFSSAFNNEQPIPIKYTCDGLDISPPLEIKDVPKKTKSLALIVVDPDAPLGEWTHWLVWNINPKIGFIEEGIVPEGATEGLNSFKKHSYGGPCPPSGIHHYYFKIFALDKELDLEPYSIKEEVLKSMEDHILDSAEIMGIYHRE